MSKRRLLRLSVSKAKTFEQCKRKFYYQYILRLKTRLKDYNAIGSLVHFILEIAFSKWIQTKYKEDLKDLIVEAWGGCRNTQKWKDAVFFGVVDQAKAYIMDYYRSYVERKDKDVLPIRCEPRFYLPLEIDKDLKVSVVGYIDRIDQIDYKTLLLLDYKTTGKVQYLDNFQLGVYVAACLYGPYKGYNINAAYVLLRHNMKLKKMKKPNDNYPKEMNKLVKIAKQIDTTVNYEKEYPPTFTRLCDYCDFRDRCYKDTGGPNKARQEEIGEDTW